METFVIRVLAAPDEPDEKLDCNRIHGVARHVATGTEAVFAHADDLIAFVHRLAGGAPKQIGPRSRT